MNKKSYYYELPEELVAQFPIEPRDSSRLLVFNKEKIEHKNFFDILNYLHEGDVLVINSTRVLPARLYGIKEETGAKVEILLQKRHSLKEWEVIAKPGKRLKIDNIIKFGDELACKIIEKKDDGNINIEFIYDGVFEDKLEKVGQMPLPHYIKKKLENNERYQTIYANENGSSAAPTAGLHFTKELISKLKEKGVNIVEVLLHVGLGTFRPVKEDNILAHKMHSEWFSISKESAEIINFAKSEKRRVIAVGTTSVRVLESAAVKKGLIEEKQGETSIFIYPSYNFKIVDGIITNFHLPESTLLMLVSAFCGYEETMKIYETAIKEKYRFFSFGDAMFITKKD